MAHYGTVLSDPKEHEAKNNPKHFTMIHFPLTEDPTCILVKKEDSICETSCEQPDPATNSVEDTLHESEEGKALETEQSIEYADCSQKHHKTIPTEESMQRI